MINSMKKYILNIVFLMVILSILGVNNAQAQGPLNPVVKTITTDTIKLFNDTLTILTKSGKIMRFWVLPNPPLNNVLANDGRYFKATPDSLLDNNIIKQIQSNGTILVTSPNGPITTIDVANSSLSNNKLVDSTITGQKIAKNQVVRSVNGISDTIYLVGAGGATVTKSNDTLTITASGGGGGGGSVNGVQNTDGFINVTNPTGPTVTLGLNIIDSTKLATGSVTSRIIRDSTIQRIDLAKGLKTYYADTADFGKAALPVGAASGDLTGNYPGPVLITTGVSSGTYGDATHSLQVTFDSKGRATNAVSVLITGTSPGGVAGGSLSGSYPNPTIANSGVTSGTYGSATQVGQYTVGADGRITASTNVTISGTTPGGTAGGDLTGTYPNPTLITTGVIGGVYGDATHSAQITFDTKGRATSVTNITISGTTPGGTAGGDLSGTYPNPTVANGAITTAKLASAAVTTSTLANGAVTTAILAANAVTGAKIANGNVVRVLNGITDTVYIVGAGGAAVTTSHDTITITAGSGGGGGGISSIQNVDGSITVVNPTGPTVTISVGTIDSTKLATGAVTSRIIRDSTIQRVDLIKGLKTYYADTADYAKAAPPVGNAGGDLTGTYPNPTLVTTGVGAGTYGDATHVSQVAVDAKGRITSASNILITGTTPGGTAGGDLSGTYPNPTLVASGVTAGTYGDATHVSQVTFDSKGRATAASNILITGTTPGGTAGGDLTGTYPNPTLITSGVVAATYGDATHSTQVTFDAKGRATSASSILITGTLPGGSAGGDLTGTYPNPTVAANTIDSNKIKSNIISRKNIAPGSFGKVYYADTADNLKNPVFYGHATLGSNDTTIITFSGTVDSSYGFTWGWVNGFAGFGTLSASFSGNTMTVVDITDESPGRQFWFSVGKKTFYY